MKNCSRHNDVVAELNAAAAFVNVRPVSSGRMKWNKKKPSTLSFWNGTNNNVTNAGGFGARFSFGDFFLLVFFIPFVYSLGCKRTVTAGGKGRVKTAQPRKRKS